MENLRNNPKRREAFMTRVAVPIATRWFERGMVS